MAAGEASTRLTPLRPAPHGRPAESAAVEHEESVIESRSDASVPASPAAPPELAQIGPTAHAVVEVTGGDRLAYLDDVLSQATRDLAPGDVRGALFLDVHGAPLAEFRLIVDPDVERVLLVCADSDLAAEVVATLGGRTFLADASFTARPDLGVSAVRGAVGALADAVLPPPDRAVVLGGALVARHAWGLDVIGDDRQRAGVLENLREAGAVEVEAATLEATRVRVGEPRWGREIAHPHLPEELGLLSTHVHLAKGCYPGQEAVARMWMLGRPRRRLARVRVAGTPEAGHVWGAGRDRVELTALAEAEGLPASGPRPGLAFVPAGAEPGTRVEDEAGSLEVVDLVGADRAVPGHDPAVLRRRDRRTGGGPPGVE